MGGGGSPRGGERQRWWFTPRRNGTGGTVKKAYQICISEETNRPLTKDQTKKHGQYKSLGGGEVLPPTTLKKKYQRERKNHYVSGKRGTLVTKNLLFQTKQEKEGKRYGKYLCEKKEDTKGGGGFGKKRGSPSCKLEKSGEGIGGGLNTSYFVNRGPVGGKGGKIRWSKP